MALIQLHNVTFDIPVIDASRSFRSAIISRYTGGRITRGDRKRRVQVRALENVSLVLRDGDRLGLIGHNGCGKSTLLKVMAGIYTPSMGVAWAEGLVTPLFNPNLGIDYEDTGYQNMLNMAMFIGMSREDLARKMPEIVEVCELGDFLDLPMRTYSAGMQVRLAFAVLTSLEPEILLLDEGIGAADARFSERADARMAALCDRLQILVLATHAEALIRRLCNKALLLEHGRVAAFGNVEEVLDVYAGRHAPAA